MMKLLLCLTIICATAHMITCAAVKGRLSASRPSQAFYGTKSAPLIQSQQQEQSQEQEAALPAFVEPPAAPVPEPDAGEPMMPYSFEYTANGEDGTGSARRESNDGQRVTGTYTLSGADGVSRVVHYVADKDGYRATIITNEPGTESQSPAATVLQSSQLPAEQIALQYGPREPAVPATSARLLAPSSSGVKGAPIRQQAAIKAPIVQAPISQVRLAPVKARLLPSPPPPPPSVPRAPSKTRATPPPPPTPAQIRSKTAPLRIQSKTNAIKAPRQPFYAATTTTTTTTTTTAAPTTEEIQQQQNALLLDEQQQQQQEEPQEFAQLQQEPQQQQQEEQELSQEVDSQQQQQSAFFSS